jgi:hypothetical protein
LALIIHPFSIEWQKAMQVPAVFVAEKFFAEFDPSTSAHSEDEDKNTKSPALEDPPDDRPIGVQV